MEAQFKALELELSKERQMRQDKEQEVGQLLFYSSSHTRYFSNRPRTRLNDFLTCTLSLLILGLAGFTTEHQNCGIRRRAFNCQWKRPWWERHWTTCESTVCLVLKQLRARLRHFLFLFLLLFVCLSNLDAFYTKSYLRNPINRKREKA